MKAYLATTAALFVAVTVAHVLRAIQESHLTRDPWFVFVTIATCGLSVWALRLLQKTVRPQPRT
jgi:hypothetical protein